MSTIAILAVIFALFIIVKISLVFIHPRGWFKFADAFLRHTIITTIVYGLLAVIVGYYILRTFSIVQVTAVLLFTSLLMGLALIPFTETMLSIREELLGSRLDILRKTWLTLLIWITIAVWTLYEAFTKKIYTLNHLP
jgi:hypothetical protein